jgi:V/A-type H+-transporting ATPase subunit D
MDKKRQVLLAELTRVKKAFVEISDKVNHAVKKAYEALAVAHLEMGQEAVARLRYAEEIPLNGTTASLNEAHITWQAAKELLVAFADMQNKMHRLTQNIRKAQKRAAALGNIIIPTYEARIKYIESQLEERSRDELARLKIIKNKRH